MHMAIYMQKCIKTCPYGVHLSCRMAPPATLRVGLTRQAAAAKERNPKEIQERRSASHEKENEKRKEAAH
jgi:hypothetical protein